MVGCSVRKCKSKSVKGGALSFFSFPNKESVAKEWLRYCGPKTTAKNGRICSNHFLPSDYFKSLKHILLNESPRTVRQLKPDAVPTIQIDNIDKQNMPSISLEVEKLNTPSISLEVEKLNTPSISPEVISPSVDTPTSGNIKSFLEFDIPSANEVAGSSNIVEKSEISITIPLAEYNTTHDSEVACSSKDVEENFQNITIPRAEYKALKRKLKGFNDLKKNLENIFTPGQIRCLMKPNMLRVRWSSEDIAAAISLRNIVTPEGYRHLRFSVGIPLPAFSTIRKWVARERHAPFSPGG